ncbi:MAG: phosphatidate cytidylyltransferase, partial [Nitrosomonadales bacterium]|nr:phosphatidate cytidylyltransferase [Nitrosomonadales bacterium]
MLKKRILSAIVMLSIFLASFFLQNPTYFLLLVFIVSGILFYELGKILKLKGLSLIIYWIFSAAPIIFFYFIVIVNVNFLDESNQYLIKVFLTNFSIIISFVSAIFWLIIVPLDILYGKISSNIKFQIFYGYFLVTPMAIVTSLVFLQNKNLLLIPFMMIWLADIGAYFVGKNFGKNKLAKNISPGKTIEGAVGGFLASILFAFVLSQLYVEDFGFLFFFAVLVTALSIFGDIYQSFLKRRAKIKDSGVIIPGHGGLLDRLDS